MGPCAAQRSALVLDAAAAHDRSSYLGDLLLRSELAHMLKAAKQARSAPLRFGSFGSVAVNRRTDGWTAERRPIGPLDCAPQQRFAGVR